MIHLEDKAEVCDTDSPPAPAGFVARLRAIARRLGLSKLKQWYFLAKYRSVDCFEVAIDGIKLRFSTEDSYSKLWFFPRYDGGKLHEEPITRLLIENLAHARCFVDCGANLGWYTCVAGKFMNERNVYGFELDDLNCELLCKNINMNDCTNVQIFRAAVTDKPGQVTYVRDPKTPPFALHISSEADNARKAAKKITVKAISFDTFFQDKEIKPDVLKIDVEGAEMQVLQGMKEILRNEAPILFLEVHPEELRTFNSSVGEVMSVLFENGYDVYSTELYTISEMTRGKTVSEKLEKLTKDTVPTTRTMLYACKGSGRGA
jgi:FkbM family methyltransferase